MGFRGKDVPDEDRLKLLGEMLWFADQAYEGESERTLHNRLIKRGAASRHAHLSFRIVQHCILRRYLHSALLICRLR